MTAKLDRGKARGAANSDGALAESAGRLAREMLILDSHIDLPFRLDAKMEDVSRETSGDFDYPRAVKGGLSAAFMAVYTPSGFSPGQAAENAGRLIRMVRGFERRWPRCFALAETPGAVRENSARGKISLSIGMENGAPLGEDLGRVEYFCGQGVRYITLTHWGSNQICDSSNDSERPWRGLSPFGRQVVREMNRLGMMIDVSHISDEAFFQIIGLSTAPVIASHSSCRHFTPGWERNMSDEMLSALRERRGVIQINFGSAFLSDAFRKARETRTLQLNRYLQANGLEEGCREAEAYLQRRERESPLPRADLADVADHIDHVVNLIGEDHVGLGSDFDGVGDSLPTGLLDVSMYPNLIRELLFRGHPPERLHKICGGNFLRVWEEVQAAAG